MTAAAPLAQKRLQLTVQAESLDLLAVVATTVARGNYLNAATAQEPLAVLGAARHGQDQVGGRLRLCRAGHRWEISKPSAPWLPPSCPDITKEE